MLQPMPEAHQLVDLAIGDAGCPGIRRLWEIDQCRPIVSLLHWRALAIAFVQTMPEIKTTLV